MAISRFTCVDNETIAWSTVNPSSGDLILYIPCNDGPDNQSAPTGFTRVSGTANAGSGVACDCGVYYKIATGSETGDIVTDEGDWGVTNEAYTVHIIKIDAADWHGTTPPEGDQTEEDSSGGHNDPPSLSPSWGAEEDTIFVVTAARDNRDGIDAAPTNYTTNFAETTSAETGGHVELGTSWRLADTATENPGAFTIGSSQANDWISHTIAVRPASSVTLQYLYPDGDQLSGGWETAPTAGQDLSDQIDEDPAVDTDYIYEDA